jgi:hypothetical protein
MKKYIFIIVIILSVSFGHILNYCRIYLSDESPICYLTKIKGQTGIVYCYIEYKKKEYVIIGCNPNIHYIFKKNFSSIYQMFYPMIMELSIRQKIPLNFNSVDFADFKEYIAPEDMIDKYKNFNTSDSTIFQNKRIIMHSSWEEINALMYNMILEGYYFNINTEIPVSHVEYDYSAY